MFGRADVRGPASDAVVFVLMMECKEEHCGKEEDGSGFHPDEGER